MRVLTFQGMSDHAYYKDAEGVTYNAPLLDGMPAMAALVPAPLPTGVVPELGIASMLSPDSQIVNLNKWLDWMPVSTAVAFGDQLLAQSIHRGQSHMTGNDLLTSLIETGNLVIKTGVPIWIVWCEQ